MIRLLAIALVVAAIQTQVASEPQGSATWTCSCNGNNQSPWTNLGSGKYQSLVANGPPVAGPVNSQFLPCAACGGYSGPVPPPGLPVAPPGLPVAPGPVLPPGLPVAPGPALPPGLPVAPGPVLPPGLPIAPGPVLPPGPPVSPALPVAPGFPIAPGYPVSSGLGLPLGPPVTPGPFVVPGPPGPPGPPLPPAPFALPGPPALPCPTGPAPPGVSPNSLVVFSQGPLPQNAPTFVQSSGPLNLPGPPIGPAAPPSHIMSIPKKDTPTTFTFTNSSPVQETFISPNSIYSPPLPPSPPGPAPFPLYYTQSASLVSTCPATVVYPAPQAQFAPPNAVVPFSPPTAVALSSPPQGSGINYSQSTSIPTFKAPSAPLPIGPPPSLPSPPPSTPGPLPIAPPVPSFPVPSAKVVAGPPTGPAGSSQSKSPLTYTLLGANKSSLPGSSLEAENNDCAMPVPPPLLKAN